MVPVTAGINVDHQQAGGSTRDDAQIALRPALEPLLNFGWIARCSAGPCPNTWVLARMPTGRRAWASAVVAYGMQGNDTPSPASAFQSRSEDAHLRAPAARFTSRTLEQTL